MVTSRNGKNDVAEASGNDGTLESVEKQKRPSHAFHRPLEIAQRRRDSHISTRDGGGLYMLPLAGKKTQNPGPKVSTMCQV